MDHPLLAMIASRRGHFRMESGYHSELWFKLDTLFTPPERVRPYVVELAQRLAPYRLDAVCGPLTGGATLAAMVGAELGLPHFAAHRFEQQDAGGLFPVRYCVAPEEAARLRSRRVAMVDDAVSAGSAVRGTYADLVASGAEPVVCGALLAFGDATPRFAAEHGLGFEAIARVAFNLWAPETCPLCQQGQALEKVSDAPA